MIRTDMKIDKQKFLFIYEQQEFKTLTDSAQTGLINLLTFMESDEHVNDARWIAYMLATTFHECAGTWQPIAEYGKGKGMKYGQPDPVTKEIYYGRGFVQLTWAGNYKTIGNILDVNLYHNPRLAMQPDIAYRIMSHGMRHGVFTGAALKRFFNDETTDPKGARRIINGTDKADLIAGYYDKFMKILAETEVKA